MFKAFTFILIGFVAVVSNAQDMGIVDPFPDEVLELDKHISEIPQAGFVYKGQKKLSKDEIALLMVDVKRKRLQVEDNDCPPENRPTLKMRTEDNVKDKDDWQVVFLVKISPKIFSSIDTPIMGRQSVAIARFNADLKVLQRIAEAGKLDQTILNKVLQDSGEFLKHDPHAAMAYIAVLGARLNENYGDSKAGSFITAVEQYGRMGTPDESVGQCSDIHYAMLLAYKQLTGNKKAKAYLVNFQTGGRLNHTDLVIEEGGQVYVVNYGEVTNVPTGSSDPLRQSTDAGSGLAYRIFGEKNQYTDEMLAHIDTPLGMFLREVSTGRASYNPFQHGDYSLTSLGLAKQGGAHVKVFIGELGGGEFITGVSVNLKGKNQLPAGFSLDRYVSGALAYSYKKFQMTSTERQLPGRQSQDVITASLQSEVLYINTGLGLISPKLDLGNFSFRGKAALAFEAGIWLKQYKGQYDQDSPFAADGNIVGHTEVSGEYKKNDISVKGSLGIEVMPSFATSFPRVADGSSIDGFGSSLGVLANRTTTAIDLTYHPKDDVSLFIGGTYMHTQLGPIGEGRVGIATPSTTVTAFLRGAMDRDKTPAFAPGANRAFGVMAKWCNYAERKNLPICISAQTQKSLENDSWQFNTSLGSDF